MANLQHILVCAQDSVLAKKVRFLLARDECEVEILDKVSQLINRLTDSGISLLILSRNLEGEDAIELMGRLDPSIIIPPTLILGGAQTITADFIRLIPDPIDTQAIYRIASDILSETTHEDEEEDDGFVGDEDLTHVAIGPPSKPTTNPGGSPPSDEELSFSDVTGLDEIAGRLDKLESDQLSDNINDAFDIDEASGFQGEAPAMAEPENQPPALGGLLEPARFAKVLFHCWTGDVTGALIVARDHETLTIHFEQGSPVHVESSIPGDQLGRALVDRGRITEEQYGDGAKRSIERGIGLGQALVDLNFFSNEELGKELGTTARDQIVGCFEARQGAFEFDAKRKTPNPERPYTLEVGKIIAEGLRRHADQQVLGAILGPDINQRYFKLSQPLDEVRTNFPLDGADISFLAFGGRAYNIEDAAETSGLPMEDAHKLLALLVTCEASDDFTPGVDEFESRIREERKRTKDLESRAPEPSPLAQTTEAEPASTPARTPTPVPSPIPAPPARAETPPPFEAPSAPPPPPSSPPQPTTPPPPPPTTPPPPESDSDIPPMPTPTEGDDGSVPRPLVYAKPLPRGPDGTPLETPERTLSREHFQRGVTLLGQGNFANAEEAFRDAVALCSEEHVYLIGLARAIYYNPGYRADGKVPVLKAIVGRAEQLAPDDKRVATLKGWIDHAESLI